MNDRSISFEKISNARDMGGLRTAQGCIISSGLLIRSANLSNATEADRNILREKYHLSKIIDLRTEMECSEMPDVSIADVDYLSIPIFGKSAAGISHEKRSSGEQLSVVLLLALGAERSTIMEDYLLTNRVNAAKSERYYQMMLSSGKTETEAETIRDIFLAKEEYLNAAFSAMDAQYEDTGAFLRDGLNIPRKLIDRFQSSVH